MKVGQIGPTFIFPVKTVTFYWVESLVTSSILKMRKSYKKLAHVYAYSHANTQIRDRGGWLGPPPWIGLMRNSFINIDFCLCFVKSINLQAFCSEMGNKRHGTKWMRLYVPWYWRYLHSSCTQSISSHYHFDLFFGSGAWRSEDCTIKTADWNCVCKKTL